MDKQNRPLVHPCLAVAYNYAANRFAANSWQKNASCLLPAMMHDDVSGTSGLLPKKHAVLQLSKAQHEEELAFVSPRICRRYDFGPSLDKTALVETPPRLQPTFLALAVSTSDGPKSRRACVLLILACIWYAVPFCHIRNNNPCHTHTRS